MGHTLNNVYLNKI